MSALYLNESTVRSCLSTSEIYQIVRSTLQKLGSGRALLGPKSGFSVSDNNEVRHLGTVSGCLLDENVAGTKWFSASPGNASRGLPRVPATVVISDATTGALQGVLDATHLTAVRTAAMACATALKCTPSPRRIAIIGPGGIGKSIGHYVGTESTVKEIVLVGRNKRTTSDALQDLSLSIDNHIALSWSIDVKQAVKDADIVFLSTGAAKDTALVYSNWLADQAVVCTVGSYREVDPSVIHAASNIIVDDIQGVQTRGGLASEFESDRLSIQDLSCDVSQLMTGTWKAEEADTGLTLISLVGIGILDVALGAFAIANARKSGLGITLE